MKTCTDIMTKDPRFALPEDTIEQVAQLMKDEDVGPIPVVENEETKKLVGIVTDRDIVLKVVAEGQDARSMKVSDIMSPNPVSCRMEDDAQKAVDAMGQHQIRRIPVVDQKGQLVGIIAQSDVATRMGENQKTAEVVKEISRPTSLH